MSTIGRTSSSVALAQAQGRADRIPRTKDQFMAAYREADRRVDPKRPYFRGQAAGKTLRIIAANGWGDAYETALKMQKRGAGRFKVIYTNGTFNLYIEVQEQ